MKRIVAMLTTAVLTGCVNSNQLALAPTPNEGGEHRLFRHDKLQYLSCDYESGILTKIYPPAPEHVNPNTSSALNLSPYHLRVAARAWPYALMASNVYRDPQDNPFYVIPGWEFASRWHSPSGLSLEEWHRKDQGQVREIAIVFEGTNFTSLADWRTNFSIIEPRQHREAFAYMQEVVQRANLENARVTATGHSLGGALALNMSLRLPNVHLFAFDTSPRAFYKVGPIAPAERYILYERGEILSFLRWPWLPQLKVIRDDPRYDFMDFIFGRSITSFKEHDMYLISRGLLLAAIKNGDAEAARAFTANFSQLDLQQAFGPDAEHDVGYCRRIFEGHPAASQ